MSVSCCDDDWVALVPIGLWPFEILLPRRRQIEHLDHLTSDESSTLASLLKILTTRYDNLFKTSFPYSMGWHGALVEAGEGWQLHAHFIPHSWVSHGQKVHGRLRDAWREPA